MDTAENVEQDEQEVDLKEQQDQEQDAEDITEQKDDGEQEDAPQEKQLSQDEVNAIILKNKARLKRQKQELEEDKGQTEAELQRAQEKIKLYEIALQQKEQPKSGPPNPDDFDGGEFDPEYLKAKDNYTQSLIDKRVEEKLSEAEKKKAEENSLLSKQQEAESKQVEHYKKVHELGLGQKYIEAEDKAIEILGNEYVTEIINNVDDPHTVLFHLGKNPAKAESLANLMQSNLVKGVVEIGRIQAGLTSVSQSNDTPEPEDTLEGATVKGNPWQDRYDSLYKKYENGKATLKDLLNLKKEAKAKGVELQ